MSESYQKKRRKEYPAIGEQLGAFFDYLNQERLNGKKLPASCDRVLGQILSVKKTHNKPHKKPENT